MVRATRLKVILWMFMGIGFAVAVDRFFFGLGASTHLSDATPWGLWIGFDVMSGVALAAGGFLLTATVYIFRLEQFHSIVRPAVLTAFLGYVAVVVGLLFDLGLPWHIWHLIIYWNPHSPLFEVGWCVMLYLSVLVLEFFPVAAEDVSNMAKVRRFLVKLRIPLVVTGIALSTLHQSSLGSLFLIMPYRLHPLWYSPWLPVLFFISAVALGLQVAIFESHATAYLYKRKPETALLAALGRAARWVLVLYLLARFSDLFVRGQAYQLAGAEWQVKWFWVEVILLGILPASLFSFPALQQKRSWQWGTASVGISGIVLNRIDVGGLIDLSRGRGLYLPSWQEIFTSLGILAAAALAYMFIMEHFKVWEQRPADPERAPSRLPRFDNVGKTWLGVPAVAGRTKFSLAFVLTAAVGFALISNPKEAAQGINPTPVHQARGWETMYIDADMSGYGVTFYHQKEVDRNGGAQSCVLCHHMNFPHDQNSGCYRCHRDMYLPTDSFRHDWHASPHGANIGCVQCHEAGKPRTAQYVKACRSCHRRLIPPGATIKVKQYLAPSYVDAMHKLCIDCHARVAQQNSRPDIAQCTECHRGKLDYSDAQNLLYKRGALAGRRVVLPPPATTPAP